MTEPQAAPDALLLISTHCPHCKSVLAHLTDLVKIGQLGHLEIYNVDQDPSMAQQRNIRSLPWFQVGPFELTGAISRSELENWLEKARTDTGMSDYFAELMQDRQVEKVISMIEKNPELFTAVVSLLSDPDAEITVKIGIGVIMETFQGKPPLTEYFDALKTLTTHEDPRIRADSSHYLGLTNNPDALPIIQQLLKDPDQDVRESAEDTLEELTQV